MKSRKKTSRADRYVTGDGTKSAIIKRSIIINGHKTSVSLEEWFWTDLKEIQAARNAVIPETYSRETLSRLVGEIDEMKPRGTNLSCAVRRFIRNTHKTELEKLRALTAAPVKRAA